MKIIKRVARKVKTGAKFTGKVVKGIARKTFTNANQTDVFPDMKKKRR